MLAHVCSTLSNSMVLLSMSRSWKLNRLAIAAMWLEYSDGLSKTATPRGCSRSEKSREALAEVMRTQDGIDFLGYRIFPTHRRLRQTTARRSSAVCAYRA